MMLSFVLAETSKIDLQMQHWMFSTTVATLLVVIAKWLADQKANKQIKEKTAETAEVAHQAKNELKRDIRENTEVSKEAFAAANALNEKILANQKVIESLQARQQEQERSIVTIIERLDGKRKRIHDIANDVNSIKLALAVKDAPPIAGDSPQTPEAGAILGEGK